MTYKARRILPAKNIITNNFNGAFRSIFNSKQGLLGLAD
jgi:hypothetical protein